VLEPRHSKQERHQKWCKMRDLPKSCQAPLKAYISLTL
jgi:hypothetical protein